MRRLAAIMFTDMVGYSALTQRNEALALDLLSEHRTILRPFFDKHEGREIETAGDSFFVEFNSAVEASNCAIEIQNALYERNKVEAAERAILVRIGIHIGDVVYMDNHVHGDGVNIAARIEPKAPPGGICISEDVARQIRNKISYPVIKLSQEKLKNISMPMDIYHIQLPWVSGSSKSTNAKKKKLPVKLLSIAGALIILAVAALFFSRNNDVNASPFTKYRVAVLPLKNISNNPQDEYFADGMTEELISSISKISGLNVIARTSIMKYKQTTKDISQIGNELMVAAILEGSVRKIANKARITVQLIDANTEENLWSMDYDRDLTDIFTIQSEIATNIAKELKVRLVQSEKDQLDKSLTSNPTAYQEYLIGKHYLNQRTSVSVRSALEHFQKSVVEDPNFALPYTQIAYCYTLIGVAGYGNSVPRAEAETKARQAVMKALELDSTLAEARAALGYIKFRIDWDWEGAERELRRAVELKPGYATAHEWLGLLQGVRVNLDEALHEMKTAVELDPLSASVNTGLARVYHFRNENKESIEQIKKTLQIEPGYADAHFSAGMTYFRLGDYANCEKELKAAIELSRRPVILGMLARAYIKSGRREEALQILKELETPPINNDRLYATAIIKNFLGREEEAFATFNKLVDEKYGIMIYLKVERRLFENNSDPRYAELIKKMGF